MREHRTVYTDPDGTEVAVGGVVPDPESLYTQDYETRHVSDTWPDWPPDWGLPEGTGRLELTLRGWKQVYAILPEAPA